MSFFPFFKRHAPQESQRQALNTLIGTVDPTSPVFAIDFERHGFPEGVEGALLAARQHASLSFPEKEALQAEAVRNWQKRTASPSLHGDETGTLMVTMAKQCFDLSKDFCIPLAAAALATMADYAGGVCYRTDLGHARPEPGARTTLLLFAAIEAYKYRLSSVEDRALENLIEATRGSITLENGKPHIHNAEIFAALTEVSERPDISPKLKKTVKDLMAGVYSDTIEKGAAPKSHQRAESVPEPSV